jgi:hypothetical protein
MLIIEFKDDMENRTQYEQIIAKYSKLSKCHLHIFLLNRPLPNSKQAVFVPKALIKCSPNGHEYTSIGYQDQHDYDWDCYIAVSKKWSDKIGIFPCYFAYLIGHELGHANIYFNDRDLYILCQLIEGKIKDASGGIINCHYQCPHEILFDRFGKYFANKVQTGLFEEIEEIKKTASPSERIRLGLIQNLHPVDCFEGLREALIDFASPYKNDLMRLWKESVRECGCESLASQVDLEDVFQ